MRKINTGGGAIIMGDVNIKGGDFIGRGYRQDELSLEDILLQELEEEMNDVKRRVLQDIIDALNASKTK